MYINANKFLIGEIFLKVENPQLDKLHIVYKTDYNYNII